MPDPKTRSYSVTLYAHLPATYTDTVEAHSPDDAIRKVAADAYACPHRDWVAEEGTPADENIPVHASTVAFTDDDGHARTLYGTIDGLQAPPPPPAAAPGNDNRRPPPGYNRPQRGSA